MPRYWWGNGWIHPEGCYPSQRRRITWTISTKTNGIVRIYELHTQKSKHTKLCEENKLHRNWSLYTQLYQIYRSKNKHAKNVPKGNLRPFKILPHGGLYILYLNYVLLWRFTCQWCFTTIQTIWRQPFKHKDSSTAGMHAEHENKAPRGSVIRPWKQHNHSHKAMKTV